MRVEAQIEETSKYNEFYDDLLINMGKLDNKVSIFDKLNANILTQLRFIFSFREIYDFNVV